MTKSVCGFCGVGCGLSIERQRVTGDKTHPVNNGLACAKGLASAEIP
ncbi:MAG: hypothetical protein GXO33_00945, partial [Epsilonproteobacteria bacterium]|nr:hypothetical protein [Campylobacterota bacterium]